MSKDFGAFNKEKLPLFDKSLMNLEYLHQTCYHLKKFVSVECLEATIQRCLEN